MRARVTILQLMAVVLASGLALAAGSQVRYVPVSTEMRRVT